MTGNVYRQVDDGSFHSIGHADGDALRRTDRVEDVVPPRVLAAESRRAFRQLLEDSSLGCPNSPRCFRMLVDHTYDGWDAGGNPINPRCPEGHSD